MRSVCLYGGAPIGKQLDALKKRPQIVVATPGRLSDHLKRRSVRVETAKTVVLDEADRMLDMGFVQDVTRLLDRMKNRRNLGLFSATISREVMDIAWVYQRDAAEVTVREDAENKPDIRQFRMEVDRDGKAAAIAAILEETGFDRCMVFCNTKGSAERIAHFLQMRGVDAACIHGDIPQKRREAVLERFSLSPRTWRQGGLTWTTWTLFLMRTCPTRITTISIGLAGRDARNGRAWR